MDRSPSYLIPHTSYLIPWQYISRIPHPSRIPHAFQWLSRTPFNGSARQRALGLVRHRYARDACSAILHVCDAPVTLRSPLTPSQMRARGEAASGEGRPCGKICQPRPRCAPRLCSVRQDSHFTYPHIPSHAPSSCSASQDCHFRPRRPEMECVAPTFQIETGDAGEARKGRCTPRKCTPSSDSVPGHTDRAGHACFGCFTIFAFCRPERARRPLLAGGPEPGCSRRRLA